MSVKSVTVDMRSDTVTKPTDKMKNAMFTAEVGDDVFGEDPTVNALEKKVADILGKEASVFLPSGTMANLIAIMVHCNRRGAEMLCGDKSHIARSELGGAAHLAGVFVSTLKNLPDGTFDLMEMEYNIRGSDIHEPITMMVAVENTHNQCGGRVLPLDWIDKLAGVARKRSLLLHMDGSRLFNASEYSRTDPTRIARDFDSVSVCFSKGLGAPVGAALAGTRRFVEQARRLRKMLGGGMRQVGVLAAAAMVGLDDVVPSLYADHKRALYLARAIHELKLTTFTVDIENLHTNIVNVNINEKSSITSSKIVSRLSTVSELESKGDCKSPNNDGIVVKASAKQPKVIRFVLHYDINDDDLRLAVKKVCFVLKEQDRL